MVIYTLHVDQHDGHHLEGVFSSSDKAHAAAAEARKIWGYAEVEEIRVDDLVGAKAIPIWNSTIDLVTGELVKNQFKGDYNERKQFIWENDNPLVYEIDAACLLDLFKNMAYVARTAVVYSRDGLAAVRKKAKKVRSEFICGVDPNTSFVDSFAIYDHSAEIANDPDWKPDGELIRLADLLT